jgi:hypothetical protein
MTETPAAGATPTTQNSTLSGSAVGGVAPNTTGTLTLNPTNQTTANGNGYPANTPVENMNVEQQAAYWREQARKHEKAWQGKLGRDVTPDAYADQIAELERLRGEVGTETDRKISQARKEERAAVAAEYGPRLVRAALGGSLAAMAEADRAELLDTINPAAFLTPEGEVDTAKVQTFVTKFVPGAATAPNGAGTAPSGHVADHGGGRRGTTMPSPREAGLAEAQRRFGNKAAATS